MNKETQSNIRYRIYAQNRGDILIIEIIGTEFFISRKAHEILADSNFIQGFSQKEIAIIKYIAASE